MTLGPSTLRSGQRLGHVAVRHRRQVAVAEGVKKFWGVGSGITCSLITHGAILVHLLPFVPTTLQLSQKWAGDQETRSWSVARSSIAPGLLSSCEENVAMTAEARRQLDEQGIS